jgi:DNA-binding response OmpR family regulator
LQNALAKRQHVGPTLPRVEVSMPKVLIVEDDRDYADALMRALRETDPAFPSARFDVNSTSDPDVAIQYAERDAIDIFIVDLKLSQKIIPETEDIEIGKSLIKTIQEKTNAGIIVHTSVPAEQNRAELIELGADDYIEKMTRVHVKTSRNSPQMEDRGPDHIIRAKIVSLWRRVQLLRPAHKAIYRHANRTFQIGTWKFVIGSRVLTDAAGKEVKLSSAEHALLRYLCVIEDHSVDREQFNAYILGRDKGIEDRRIDNLIYRLRIKLGPSLTIVADEGAYKLIGLQEVGDTRGSVSEETSPMDRFKS